MKKMLVAAFAMTIAVIANAAAINWSVTGVTAPTGKSLTAGWSAIFVVADALPSGVADMTASDWATFATANAASTGALASSRTGFGYTGSTADAYAASSDITGYIVVFDAASIADAENIAYTTPTTKTTAAAGNLTWATTFATTSGWTATAGGGSAPEPTSGLLLLLGMAGLALKRKVA